MQSIIPTIVLTILVFANGAFAQPMQTPSPAGQTEGRDVRLVGAGPGGADRGAADRVALVIGNSNYEQNGVLRNPSNDADAVEAALKPLGFTVIKKKDLDLAGMEDAIVTFRRTLTKGGVGLFFYAGHGMQVKGENFLVPVGAHMREEFEVKRQCLQLASILEAMDESESNLKIVVLDCCRDDPFKRSWSRSSTGGGLAALSNVPEGTVIAFATSPDKTAADGTGANSPYTENLVKVLNSRPAGGLELRDVFFDASREVKQQTGQVPWLNMDASLDKFFLWPGSGPLVANSSSPTPTTAMNVTPKTTPPGPVLVPELPAVPKDSTVKTSRSLLRLGLWHGDSAKSFDLSMNLFELGHEMTREHAILIAESKTSRDHPYVNLLPNAADAKRQMDPKEMLKLTEIDAVILYDFKDPKTLTSALLSCVASGHDCIVIESDPAIFPPVVQRLRADRQLSKLFDTNRIVWIKQAGRKITPEDRGIGHAEFEDVFDSIRLRYMVTSTSILRYLDADERPPSTLTLRVFETRELVPSARPRIDPASAFD